MIEVETDVSAMIAQAAEPLPDIDDPAFGAMFDRYGDARVVLLVEASHGTSEFYRARDAISRRLIERHGFNIVAVEADWPDAATVDRYVRHRPAREGEFSAFDRFPTWMWRNREFDAFIRWLQGHNHGRPYEQMCGFYGLDITCADRCGPSSTIWSGRIPSSPGLRSIGTAASSHGPSNRSCTAATR
jgi:erythromycin esterase-like protein